MKTTEQDGGAAFPGGLWEPQHGGSNDREPWNPGMTLRDYFAGRAMPWALTQFGCETPFGFCSDPAALAYADADAMIAARSGVAAESAEAPLYEGERA